MKRYPTINVEGTGRRIRQIMQRKGLSVRDVQEYLGLVTPRSIYHWFIGRNMPTIDNLYALSELFEVPVDELLCGNRKINYSFTGFRSCYHLFLYYEKYEQLKVG